MKLEEITYKECPICSSEIHKWHTKQNGAKEYKIDICKACGYAFVNPRPSLSFLMDYYQSSGHEPGNSADKKRHITYESVSLVERQDPNSTLDAKRIFKSVNYLQQIKENKTFLDVGCGYGFFSKEAQNNGFNVSALELAEVERNIAKQMTGVEPVESSFEDFTATPNSFNVVLMSQILEHALDINEWLNKAYSLLKPNGIVVISLPNFGSIFRKILQENEPFITPPTHLNFFDSKNLSLLLLNHGFKVEKIEYVSRLSTKALERRLPILKSVTIPIMKIATKILFSMIDQSKMGMIVTIYGRKISE